MNTTATPPPANPPDDPVHAALADPEIHANLHRHACMLLRRRLQSQSAQARSETARDVVQNTLARALEIRNHYDPARATPSAWLHGILGNMVAESVRSLRRQPVQAPKESSQWELLATDRAPQAFDEIAARLDVAKILADASPAQQQILKLRFIEELENDEIAERLGIGLGNVRVRVCRTLKDVAKSVAGEGRP